MKSIFVFILLVIICGSSYGMPPTRPRISKLFEEGREKLVKKLEQLVSNYQLNRADFHIYLVSNQGERCATSFAEAGDQVAEIHLDTRRSANSVIYQVNYKACGTSVFSEVLEFRGLELPKLNLEDFLSGNVPFELSDSVDKVSYELFSDRGTRAAHWEYTKTLGERQSRLEILSTTVLETQEYDTSNRVFSRLSHGSYGLGWHYGRNRSQIHVPNDFEIKFDWNREEIYPRYFDSSRRISRNKFVSSIKQLEENGPVAHLKFLTQAFGSYFPQTEVVSGASAEDKELADQFNVWVSLLEDGAPNDVENVSIELRSFRDGLREGKVSCEDNRN